MGMRRAVGHGCWSALSAWFAFVADVSVAADAPVSPVGYDDRPAIMSASHSSPIGTRTAARISSARRSPRHSPRAARPSSISRMSGSICRKMARCCPARSVGRRAAAAPTARSRRLPFCRRIARTGAALRSRSIRSPTRCAAYWEAHDGASLLGLPISEEFGRAGMTRAVLRAGRTGVAARSREQGGRCRDDAARSPADSMPASTRRTGWAARPRRRPRPSPSICRCMMYHHIGAPRAISPRSAISRRRWIG